MMDAVSLKHIQIEGYIVDLDFKDGALELQGPDAQYLLNILAYCKEKFKQFQLSANASELPIKELNNIFSADIDATERCHISFYDPVKVLFDFSEKTRILQVTISKPEHTKKQEFQNK